MQNDDVPKSEPSQFSSRLEVLAAIMEGFVASVRRRTQSIREIRIAVALARERYAAKRRDRATRRHHDLQE